MKKALKLLLILALILTLSCTEDKAVISPQPDRTPPDLWWESPISGSILQDTAHLSLHWLDESGVDSVRLFKDGLQFLTAVVQGVQGSYEFCWNTRADSDGVHLWEARAWDIYGGAGVSPALLVKVQNHEPPQEDRIPPVVRWISPPPGD
ncbi:MAG: Ig-like domain-containing protein, partial [Calditrichota bacterium]